MPRIIGLYLPSGGKVYGSLSSKIMTDPVQLKIFLETNQIWPLYAKPSHLQQAIGCFLLQGYDPRKKHIILGAGSQVYYAMLGALFKLLADKRRE